MLPFIIPKGIVVLFRNRLFRCLFGVCVGRELINVRIPKWIIVSVACIDDLNQLLVVDNT